MKFWAHAVVFSVIPFLALLSSLARSADPAPVGASPDVALRELKIGNERFANGLAAHVRQDVAWREELAKGQTPSAIILSCSDSRVPPELVFDRGLGDLFVVRVAGNVLGAGAVASIEYAIEHLGTRLVVVMGHESCGAVKAALTTPRGQSAGSLDLDYLVHEIQPAIEGVDRQVASADPTLRRPVMLNVDSVAARLVDRSKIIRRAVETDKIRIVRAVYGLKSGKVDFWAEEPASTRRQPASVTASARAAPVEHADEHHGAPIEHYLIAEPK